MARATWAVWLAVTRLRGRAAMSWPVVVTVVRVNGDKVRIGIEAPSTMKVLRDELDVEAVDEVRLEGAGELPISRLCSLAG